MSSDRTEATLDLVAQAQAGSVSAQEELFSRCYRKVPALIAGLWGLGKRQVMSHEDAVQEGVVWVLQKLDKFDHGSEPKFWGWVATGVSRRLKDLRAKELAQKRGGGQVQALADHGSALSPSRVAGSYTPVSKPIRVREEVERAMAQLTDRQRELIVYRDLCEMDYDEIAVLANLKNAHSARRALSEAWTALMNISANKSTEASGDPTTRDDRSGAEGQE